MPAIVQSEMDGKLLEIHFSGKLTREDYEHLVPQMNDAVGRNHKVRVLIDMHDLQGWTPGAAWEDFKFAVHHFNHIERLVVVGEKTWHNWAATFCKPFTMAEVRYFDQIRLQDAIDWLHEASPLATSRG